MVRIRQPICLYTSRGLALRNHWRKTFELIYMSVNSSTRSKFIMLESCSFCSLESVHGMSTNKSIVLSWWQREVFLTSLLYFPIKPLWFFCPFPFFRCCPQVLKSPPIHLLWNPEVLFGFLLFFNPPISALTFLEGSHSREYLTY